MSEKTSTVERELFFADVLLEAGEAKEEFDEFFTSILKPHGVRVEEVRFIRTPPPERKFRGWGFATVIVDPSAPMDEIVAAVTGTPFWGRAIDIKPAKPRPPKPGRVSL